MKRFGALLLLLGVFAYVGCGQQAPQPAAPATQEAQEPAADDSGASEPGAMDSQPAEPMSEPATN